MRAAPYLLAGIILFFIFQEWRIGKVKNESESKSAIIKEKQALIEKVKLESGKSLFQKERAESDLKTALAGYGFLEDSLKRMGVKPKQAKAITLLTQETAGEGEGRVDTVFVESEFNNLKISINEPFFKLSGTLFKSGVYEYQYQTFDSLSIVNTIEGGLFKRRRYKVKVLNANPRATLTGITSLTIKENPRKWSLGISAGYGITNESLSPFVGLGVHYSVLRF